MAIKAVPREPESNHRVDRASRHGVLRREGKAIGSLQWSLPIEAELAQHATGPEWKT